MAALREAKEEGIVVDVDPESDRALIAGPGALRAWSGNDRL